MLGLTKRDEAIATVGLAISLVLELVVGIAYARIVPPFNNPDEPAHWNFIVHVAMTGQLPTLKVGDYPEALVNDLKTSHFPPDRSIEPIVYESHQPPLYYAIGAAVYKLTVWRSIGTAIFAVKLLSVLFGVSLVATTYAIARELCPEQPAVWVGASSFVALLPMHANMTAAINNDTLGDLLLAVLVLLCMRRMRGEWSPVLAIGAGVVLGLGLLTKVTVYVGLPLLVAAEAMGQWRAARTTRRRQRRLFALTALIALVLAGWWPIRNMFIYGPTDPVGLQRNQLVVTQPLTGPITGQSAARWMTITFDSFWGQFGWMGIPLDGRIYRLLLVASALAVLGAGIALLRRTEAAKPELVLPGLLALWLLLVIGDDIYYNLTFIQAQGRYLFPAVPAFAILFAGGLLTFVGQRWRWLGALGLASSLLVLDVYILKDVLQPYFHA